MHTPSLAPQHTQFPLPIPRMYSPYLLPFFLPPSSSPLLKMCTVVSLPRSALLSGANTSPPLPLIPNAPHSTLMPRLSLFLSSFLPHFPVNLCVTFSPSTCTALFCSCFSDSEQHATLFFFDISVFFFALPSFLLPQFLVNLYAEFFFLISSLIFFPFCVCCNSLHHIFVVVCFRVYPLFFLFVLFGYLFLSSIFGHHSNVNSFTSE